MRLDYSRIDMELDELGIEVIDYEFLTCDAITIIMDGKYYIGITTAKELSIRDRYWLILHELEHIKYGTFYSLNDDKFVINRNEIMTNDSLIMRLGIVNEVMDLLLCNKAKWEICEELDMPYDIYDHCIDFINRKGITLMRNRIALLCHKNGYTKEVLAHKLGISVLEAEDYINEKIVIRFRDLNRLCELFDCSQEYLMCL